MSTDYHVLIEPFAERHFIKNFEKKYKGAWDITLKALVQEFRSFDVLFDRNIAETIHDGPAVKICKTEFKISGRNESRHGSGNRCIVAVRKNAAEVAVLLVYHKSDLGRAGSETAQ